MSKPERFKETLLVYSTHQKSYGDELQDFCANRSIFFLPTKLKEQSNSSMCSSFIHS